ncbi:hypothetical protein GGQ73_003581 [Rhizobium skierniewicense]|uniref:Uncharacterized protein n=1 Tax=Rhizobium skierniewicense TaxID=984260 RepID=A0A7W6G2X7_9HYPH|nr:hypothetical protein [Rhizobium skierniewicense]MBB3947613.1 hypothetical protein [Rhizobium skierniewicense]
MMKRILEHSQVSGKFNWRRKHTVFRCGGNYAYQCDAMLTACGIDIIYFEKDDDGFDTLSMNIYDICFNKIAEMRKNDWICRNNVDEIEATPRTPKILIKSEIHRINLELEFKSKENMEYQELQAAQRLGVPPEEDLLLVTLTGSFPAPCYAQMTHDNLIVNGKLSFSKNLFSNTGKAIVIG